jgi:hypothetical protein
MLLAAETYVAPSGYPAAWHKPTAQADFVAASHMHEDIQEQCGRDCVPSDDIKIAAVDVLVIVVAMTVVVTMLVVLVGAIATGATAWQRIASPSV